MHVQELDALVTQRTTAESVKLTSDDFGAAAAPLVTEWLGGALTVTGVTRSTRPDGTVVLNGTTDLLGVTGRPVTGIEIGLDPADQRPSLYLPFTLPITWRFPTSFPETKDSDLARLAFAREPEFLLSSTVRPAADGRPPLRPGLTFHGAGVTKPDAPEWLGELLTLAQGALALSGPVTRTAGPEKKRRAEITLTSPARGAGVLGASFFLWAGSRTTTTDDGTSTVTHPVCLRADLALGQDVTATVSAPLPTGNDKVAFTAEVLPGEHLPAAILASGRPCAGARSTSSRSRARSTWSPWRRGRWCGRPTRWMPHRLLGLHHRGPAGCGQCRQRLLQHPRPSPSRRPDDLAGTEAPRPASADF
ncbi:hypothetical protein [Streptomyces spinosus]|uniref:hypothetical protein n=1 Tax=Streptomyces spinosus TaxID=2872623 RepID=UPI001CECB621|nr:hypothetical protein [Streptomyces spinosus]